jgi:tRNA(Ile)-lysidine synthase
VIFRDSAAAKAQEQADFWGFPLSVIRSPEFLEKEAQMRSFRRRESLRELSRLGFDWIAQAHHLDDLVETRLFRLLRGTGVQGLRAMDEFSEVGRIIRPFLKYSKSDLQDYVSWHRLSWIEDPSNNHLKYQRNWIRHRLMPALEKQFPGALSRLNFFFEEVLELYDEVGDSKPGAVDLLKEHLKERPKDKPTERPTERSKERQKQQKFSRKAFCSLSTSKQTRYLAKICADDPGLAFSREQLREIQQRLLSPRKNQHFVVAGRSWATDAFSFWKKAREEALQEGQQKAHQKDQS